MVIGRESLKTKKAFPRKNACFCRYIDKICVLEVFFFLTIGTLRNYDGDGDGNGNLKNAMGLLSKTTTLHVHHSFLYISLLSPHNYDVKWPNFKFTWERKRQGDKFYHLCLNSDAKSIFQRRFHGCRRCRIVSSLIHLRRHPDNTGTLPCPIIRVRIVQFQLILPWYDTTS